jgi:peptide maturation system acyl carrier-related protein
MIKKNEIGSIIDDIFFRYSGIDFSQHENLKSKNVFGTEISLAPRDLVLILFDLEQEFGIEIPKEIIASGHFDCYSHITETVINQL